MGINISLILIKLGKDKYSVDSLIETKGGDLRGYFRIIRSGIFKALPHVFFGARRWCGTAGNVLLAVYATIGMVAVVGSVSMSVLKGPVRGMHTVTQNTIVLNDMIAAVALLSETSLAESMTADCDGDGMIEPIPYKNAPAGTPAPSGGGLLPDTVGANKTDPWKGLYGYCVWDHGTAVKTADCGGASVNRLQGGDIATSTVIAVISAGPDRTFQTSCVDYVAEGTPVVNRYDGSDDVVKEVAYGAFLLPRMTDAKIGEKPDGACTAQTVGTMRIELGVVQVCMDTGWEEVGTSAQADSEFIAVTNADLSAQYESNQISFSGFMNTKTLTVTGAATLLINGGVKISPATIKAGDLIALRANAAATPETTNAFSISLSGVRKGWTIRTRDYYPPSLTITPAGNSSMNVAVPGTPGYGSSVGFLVKNTGEVASVALSVNLSNLTNFQFYPDAASGNGCGGKVLAPNDVCVVDIRPYADGETSYTGQLTVTSSPATTSATLSGTASGWNCTSPWGATVNHNASMTAYQTNSVAYDAACVSETRGCNLGVLSGTYTHQTCAPVAALDCARPWGGTVTHSASITAYAAASVPYDGSCQSQTRTCTNGTLSGSYTSQNCTVAPPDLVNGAHTSLQCTSSGGTVITSGSNKFCRFNGGGCPSGWAPYQNWATFSGGKWCEGCEGSKCAPPSRAWGNAAQPYCTYDLNDAYGCRVTTYCYSTVTQRGCY